MDGRTIDFANAFVAVPRDILLDKLNETAVDCIDILQCHSNENI